MQSPRWMVACGLVLCAASISCAAEASRVLIRDENAKPGTLDCPGLVGWEHHGAPAKLPGLEIVAEGTTWAGGVTPAHWTATIFPGAKNNFVFNAATIFWVQGLSMPPGHTLPWSHWSRPHGPDARVQQMTHNLLRRGIEGIP